MSKDNGGPAFPFSVEIHDQVPADGRLHALTYSTVTHNGMTLRDYFAAKAVSGMDALPWSERGNMDGFSEYCSAAARTAYAIADAMLAERAK